MRGRSEKADARWTMSSELIPSASDVSANSTVSISCTATVTSEYERLTHLSIYLTLYSTYFS